MASSKTRRDPALPHPVPLTRAQTDSSADPIVGVLKITPSGRAFLVPETPGHPKIVVPSGKTATALDGDRVAVRLIADETRSATRQKNSGPERTARVVRVLARHRWRHVGTLRRRGTRFEVSLDDPCAPFAIELVDSLGIDARAHLGAKVVVEIVERAASVAGRIVEILGPPDSKGVDTLCVLRQYGLSAEFPAAVEALAQACGSAVARRDLERREDCRAHRVVTIDPKDARDFDDAFCLEPRAAGGSTLWIHIADVSHYVREGSLLDREARARGNSTYLVDRVIPMLPESLSNGLCSLLPNVDRLTVCVEFALSDDGIVEGAKFYPAVIRSQRRFSYEEVSAILARKPANAIERMLVAADRIASRMRRRRFSSGAFDLEMPETKIHLDAAGRVSCVSPASHDSAHRLIEEFMLLANEAVAAHLARQKKPMLHRIHEEPEPDRIASFRATVQKSRVRCGDLRQRAEVQDLLARLHESQDGALLRVGFLKAMSRARYATQPLGHYGLAKEHYTHFTSPIRRYADLVVHRLLRRVGASSPSKSSEAELSEIANHVSATERNSAVAERVSKVVKLLAHFADQLRMGKRDRYTATIVAVREFGFFVDLEGLGIGGLVRESRSRREVGDRLEVEVEGIDPGRREARFIVARSDDSRTREPPAARVNRPARLGTLRG